MKNRLADLELMDRSAQYRTVRLHDDLDFLKMMRHRHLLSFLEYMDARGRAIAGNIRFEDETCEGT